MKSLWLWLTGKRLGLRVSRGVLLTKGRQRDGSGWFLNVYRIGTKSHYMGYRNGRFYHRPMIPYPRVDRKAER